MIEEPVVETVEKAEIGEIEIKDEDQAEVEVEAEAVAVAEEIPVIKEEEEKATEKSLLENNRSFSILEKDFIFANDNEHDESKNMQKEDSNTSSLSEILFDMDIELSGGNPNKDMENKKIE